MQLQRGEAALMLCEAGLPSETEEPMHAEPAAITTAVLPTKWRKALLLGFTATLVMAWLPALLTSYWLAVVIVPLILAAAFAPVIFLSVTIRVSAAGIRATLFPICRISLPRDRITRIRVLDQRGGIHEGMGLRSLGDRTWGLVVGVPAIHVQTAGGKSWALSTPDPVAVVAAYEQHAT